MRKYKYITNRTLTNKSGEERGKIRILVRIDSDNAEVDYICPECGNAEHIVKLWKRPFSVRCGKCGLLIRVPRLRGK